MTAEEQNEMVNGLCYGGRLEYNRDETFVDMFLRQAEERGGKTACADVDGKMSYSDLALASKVVANRLIELGVKPGDFVLVKMPRCKEYLIPVIGVLRAGACWVPVDPEYPEERINYMIEDCGAKVTIDVDWLLNLRKHYGLKALTLPKVNLAKPDGLAYMLYTSGSTGKPKGVMLPHKALRAFIAWMIDRFKMEPGCRHAEHCSFCFDLSVMDLTGTLAAGGEVHIIHEEIRRDLDAVNEFLKERKIEGMVFGTQFGTELLNNCEVPLKYIVLCGEKLLPFRKQRADLEVINMYGPTEFTIGCSEHVVDLDKDSANIPIGRPYPNTWNFIVDKDMNLLPRGEVGELCLAGAQMGAGYWQKPDKTAAAFVPCPFLKDQGVDIMYRTGDLAKWGDDGELLCLGRIDHQVKIRGFRIELGEIENVAKTFANVNLVAAAAKEIAGIKHLVLYYTVTGEVDEAAFKAHLEKTLAYYMIPEMFVKLDSMPMTPNGKIDRKLLPEPELKRENEYVAPSGAKENAIAKAFAEVLSLPESIKVGANDSFFSLGGESLKAIRLSNLLKKNGIPVSVADIMRFNTVRELAKVDGKAVVSSVEAKSALDDAPWTREQRIAAQKKFADLGYEIEHAYPVAGLQELMAMAADEPDGGAGFNELLHFQLDAIPEEKVLRKALDRLAERHEVLRTAVLHRDLDEPVQVILKGRQIPLEYRDLTQLTGKAQEDEIAKIARTEIDKVFDVENDPLFRVVVLKKSATTCDLIIALYHIIFDGTSAPVFVGDLRRFLAIEMAGGDGVIASIKRLFTGRKLPKGIRPRPIQPGRHERFIRALKARDTAPAMDFWQKVLAGWDDKSVLPGTVNTDLSGKPAKCNSVTIEIPEEVSRALEKVAHAEQATVYTCFELAWGRVLQSCNGKNDCFFAKMVSRRDLADEDSQDAVGLFMGVIGVRVKSEPGETVHQALHKLRDFSAEATAYEYCSEYALANLCTRGVDAIQSIVVSADYGHEDGGDIPGTLTFHQLPPPGNNGDDLEIRPRKMDNGNYAVDLVYRPDLFSEEDMRKGSEALRRAIEGIALTPEAEFVTLPAYM